MVTAQFAIMVTQTPNIRHNLADLASLCKDDKFVYVRVLKTLEAPLQNPSLLQQVIVKLVLKLLFFCLFAQVLSPHTSSDNFLRDICDGR